MLCKRFYKIISESIIPNISIEQIGQILSEAQRLPPSASYELKEFPVNFKSVLEGTRKDIIFHYKHLIPQIKTSNDGNKIIDGWKDTGRIDSVDIISFFTKIKNNTSEHRIYQIGRRYSGIDVNF